MARIEQLANWGSRVGFGTPDLTGISPSLSSPFRPISSRREIESTVRERSRACSHASPAPQGLACRGARWRCWPSPLVRRRPCAGVHTEEREGEQHREFGGPIYSRLPSAWSPCMHSDLAPAHAHALTTHPAWLRALLGPRDAPSTDQAPPAPPARLHRDPGSKRGGSSKLHDGGGKDQGCKPCGGPRWRRDDPGHLDHDQGQGAAPSHILLT